MTTSQGMDLGAMIDLQKQYSLDLMALDNSGSANVINLNTKLNDLNNSMIKNGAKLQDTITKQNQVGTIINSETDYLMTQNRSVDDKIAGQQRIIDMNTNSRKRYSVYIRIMVVVICTLAVGIVLKVIKQIFPIIPNFIIGICYALIFGACLYYIIIQLMGLNARDQFDYDKLNLPPPTILSPTEQAKLQAQNSQQGSLLSVNLGCYQAACCDPNTTEFDAILNVCMPKKTAVSGFTTLSDGYRMDKRAKINASKNSPNEFTAYAWY
jgi:hypothetical protein